MKYLIPLNEIQVGIAHSPPKLYTFSREAYTKTMHDDLLNPKELPKTLNPILPTIHKALSKNQQALQIPA